MASWRVADPFELRSTPIQGTADAVRFPSRLLLAPMEGVTDRAFRDAVLDLGGVGGACTEFLRISVAPLSRKVVTRELGPRRDDTPVGVQIMAAGDEHVAESARRAEAAGAPFLDLNFGCPVKCVFGKGAGAALLEQPETIGRIVDAAVRAVRIPVTAKIRAGVNDDARLDDVVSAVAESGAAGLCIHARLRSDSYAAPARWDWIARAVEGARRSGTGMLVIGNGGVDVADDAQRMIDETSCDAVMIGRAAMRDPFLFRRSHGAAAATRTEALAFLRAYYEAMTGRPRYRLGRMKQLVRVFEAGDCFADDLELRGRLLRLTDADEFARELFGQETRAG